MPDQSSTHNPSPAVTPGAPSGPPPDAALPTVADGLALFHAVFTVAMRVLTAFANRLNTDLFYLSILHGMKVADCLYKLVCVQLTLEREPKRITARQLARLAKALRFIQRLTGDVFDFTPWSSLTKEQLDKLSPPLPPSESAAPGSAPAITLPRHRAPLGVLRNAAILTHPGATLARVCQTLCFLLKKYPMPPADPAAPSADSTITPIPSFESSAPSPLAAYAEASQGVASACIAPTPAAAATPPSASPGAPARPFLLAPNRAVPLNPG